MLTRIFPSIWINIKIDKQKHFRIMLPVSLYAFNELLECALDILSLVRSFTPTNNKVSMNKSISIHTIYDLLLMIMDLFSSITEYGPYDLVEVNCDNVNVSIKIR